MVTKIVLLWFPADLSFVFVAPKLGYDPVQRRRWPHGPLPPYLSRVLAELFAGTTTGGWCVHHDPAAASPPCLVERSWSRTAEFAQDGAVGENATRPARGRCKRGSSKQLQSSPQRRVHPEKVNLRVGFVRGGPRPGFKAGCGATGKPHRQLHAANMRCDGDPEALSRRRAVASLLVFAKELEKAGRISKASKGLLKGRST